ncbi:protein spaetzle 4 [Anopheles cruzii]|uniref:protein spaetzle 4 n=1 Tax=Anopheles cruzii TaxID=68878 RepID=UPI0022EC3996|nr:protein spaetzle 4 [Anopheles cruzii]
MEMKHLATGGSSKLQWRTGGTGLLVFCSVVLAVLLLPLLTGTTIAESYGYDSASSCDPTRTSRRGRSQLLKTIPCDLSVQAYCNLPGSAYPWHAVRRFVHENQGLMRRMYGDVRHISVLKGEIDNNEIDVDDIDRAAERYARPHAKRRPEAGKRLKYLRPASQYEVPPPATGGAGHYLTRDKNNEIPFNEPHFRPAQQKTTSTTTVAPSSSSTSIPATTAPTTANPITTARSTESSTTGESPPHSSSSSSSGGNVTTEGPVSTTEAPETNEIVSTSERTTAASNKTFVGDIFLAATDPANGTFISNSIPIGSPIEPPIDLPALSSLAKLDTDNVAGDGGDGNGKISSTLKLVTTTTTTAKTVEVESTIGGYPNDRLDTVDGDDALGTVELETVTGNTVTTEAEEASVPAASSALHSQKIRFESIKPSAAASAKKPPGATAEGQLFQDAAQKETPTTVTGRGVNACPVKEEVVAPFWANNTRGEVLALLNLYPFEQYVHWEKCTHELKQMYCREGCRCEQQFRLHRLLAYDPHNECRGIFSDWFRFPSCCICKCYDMPFDVRVTSRSPRSLTKESIEQAEDELQNAIYEHAIDDWYRRPKDDDGDGVD